MTNHAFMIVCAVCAIMSSAVSARAASPTFDCAKATHEIEGLICQDDELAQKDQLLDKVYSQALASLAGASDEKTATSELKTRQRGWVGGRDDCWKADDKRQCTLMSYDRRIAELQAAHNLVPAIDPVFYTCQNNPANEIVATFFETDPPAVRLERGDSQEIAIQGISGSGARYEGSFGIVFWVKGDEAMVEWPEGNGFDCKLAK